MKFTNNIHLVQMKKMNCFFFLLILLSSCSTKEKPEIKEIEKEVKTESIKPEIKKEAQKEITEKPKPLKIYRDFSKLEKRFSTNSDSTYIINFWATWCKPCVEELPAFFEVEKKYRNQKIKLILISLDFKKQIDKKLKPFLEKRKITTEVVVLTDPDSNTWINKISRDWSGAIPATLMFNKDKKGFYEQSFTKKELEELLLTYLN